MATKTMSAQLAELMSHEPPASLQIRRLSADDLDAIADLHSMVYRNENVGSAREQVELFWQGAYGPLFAPACLGAWTNTSLVGVVVVIGAPPYGIEAVEGPFIAELFVAPKQRRQGIAAALVQAAAAAAEQAGQKTISLRLDLGKAPEAFALYEFLGFETLD